VTTSLENLYNWRNQGIRDRSGKVGEMYGSETIAFVDIQYTDQADVLLIVVRIRS